MQFNQNIRDSATFQNPLQKTM